MRFWHAILGLAASIGHAASGELQVKQRCFFADREVSIPRLRVTMSHHRLAAQLYYRKRCVVRAEVPAEQPELRFTFPTLRPGLTAETLLSYQDRLTGKQQFETLHFYSKEPFKNHQKLLKGMKITVVGTQAGPAVKALAALGVPSTPISDPLQATGKWLICTGEVFPGVAGAGRYEEALKKGCNVLVIPPFTGRIALDWSRLSSMQFGREELIRAFDARLDTQSWGADTLVQSGIKLGQDGEEIVLEFSKKGNWTWFSCQSGRSQLIFCGWDLIKHLSTHPAPSQILKRLFVDQFTIQPQIREK